jgi:hypothetical protein
MGARARLRVLPARKRKRPEDMPLALTVFAPRVGLEPTTKRLTVACSTIELPRNMFIPRQLTLISLARNGCRMNREQRGV